MEYDPPSKKKPPAGDGMLDLPIGPGASPSAGGPAKPDPRPGPGAMGGQTTTPRHQHRRRKKPTRRRRRLWPLWLLLLTAAAGAAYWFFFRPPVAAVDVEQLDFSAIRVGREGESGQVEIVNRGRLPLEVSSIVVGGAATDDFAVTADGCTGASLGPDEGCAVEVAFEPVAAGARVATLEVASNTAGDPLAVPLLGSGLAPSVVAEASSLDFARVAVGKASEAKALVLRNGGTAPLAIARLAVEGSGESSFVWVNNGCSGETLAPEETCTVRLAFRPRETGGFKAELRVWSDAPEDPRVALSGLGVAPGLLILPTALDFGDVRPGERSVSREVRFENTGNAPLAIERIELGGDDAAVFSMAANTCDGKTLAAEENCAVAVRYEPREPARHEATLRVRASGLQRRREVDLRGVGLAPRIEVETRLVDFGQVVEYGTNESSMVVRNTGSASLDLAEVSIEGGGGAFGISGRGCPESLAPGTECTLRLRFSPSRVGGADGELRLRHDAGAPISVRLIGTGTALPKGEAGVEPRRVEFGSLQIDQRSEILTVRVRSVGAARLELEGYELTGRDAGDFRLVPASCDGLTSLLPGSDCTIGVRFRPQGSGSRRARIVVRHAGGVLEVELVGDGF